MRGNHRFFDSSLFLFGPNNRFRNLCQRIVDARYEYVKLSAVHTGHVRSCPEPTLRYGVHITHDRTCALRTWDYKDAT